MQIKEHTVGTEIEKIVLGSFVSLLKARPRIALRRVKDPELRCAIGEYILNRGTQAEAKSLAAFEAVYSRKPVAIG